MYRRSRDKGRSDADDRKYQHRADQEHAQVAAETPGDAAQLWHMPDEIDRFLNLLHQRYHGVHQQCQADRTEYFEIEVFDEFDDPLAYVRAFLAQRGEKFEQNRIDLVLHPERLEYGKAERE